MDSGAATYGTSQSSCSFTPDVNPSSDIPIQSVTFRIRKNLTTASSFADACTPVAASPGTRRGWQQALQPQLPGRPPSSTPRGGPAAILVFSVTWHRPLPPLFVFPTSRLAVALT